MFDGDSLDTVRSLHQTIVGLRTALEDARTEIHRLRRRLDVRDEIGPTHQTQQDNQHHKSPRSATSAAPIGSWGNNLRSDTSTRRQKSCLKGRKFRACTSSELIDDHEWNDLRSKQQRLGQFSQSDVSLCKSNTVRENLHLNESDLHLSKGHLGLSEKDLQTNRSGDDAVKLKLKANVVKERRSKRKQKQVTLLSNEGDELSGSIPVHSGSRSPRTDIDCKLKEAKRQEHPRTTSNSKLIKSDIKGLEDKSVGEACTEPRKHSKENKENKQNFPDDEYIQPNTGNTSSKHKRCDKKDVPFVTEAVVEETTDHKSERKSKRMASRVFDVKIRVSTSNVKQDKSTSKCDNNDDEQKADDNRNPHQDGSGMIKVHTTETIQFQTHEDSMENKIEMKESNRIEFKLQGNDSEEAEETPPPADEEEEVDDIELILEQAEGGEEHGYDDNEVFETNEERNQRQDSVGIEEKSIGQDEDGDAFLKAILHEQNNQQKQLSLDSYDDDESYSNNHSKDFQESLEEEEEEELEKRPKHRKQSNLKSVVLVEDISKCGIDDEDDEVATSSVYRPLVHRDHLNSKKCNNSAQTEISALPACWRSEISLTRPPKLLSHRPAPPPSCAIKSKQIGGSGAPVRSAFRIPKITTTAIPMTSAPKTSAKSYSTSTTGAASTAAAGTSANKRTQLLSDISFTSQVPELSRSVDHLCQQQHHDATPNTAKTQFTTFSFSSHSSSSSSSSSLLWLNFDGSLREEKRSKSKKKHLGKLRSMSTSSVNVGGPLSTASSCVCCHCSCYTSPGRGQREMGRGSSATGGVKMKTSESMHCAPQQYSGCVTFQEKAKASPSLLKLSHRKSRTSLPDLRHHGHHHRHAHHTHHHHDDHHHGSGGDSTESLLAEASEFLRSQHNQHSHRHKSSQPTQNMMVRPFLPKSSSCLKIGATAVKVITPSGRVAVGRVRHVGPIAAREDNEVYVGVELEENIGDCDGTIDGSRYFQCETLRGLFVPFKKIVMAWN